MNKYNNNDECPACKIMMLTGRGEVTANPDLAVIRLGVQTTGEDLERIQADNAQISQAILDSLRQLGVTDIKTYQYTIDKMYDYVEGRQIDRGYSVRNIFEIRLDNLDMVGLVIDTAVNNGANVVDLINFEVSNMEEYYKHALNLAIINAIEKAKSISHLLGLPVDPLPVRIVENSSQPIPFGETLARESRAMPITPIEPGNKEIIAFVTVEFIY